MIDRGPIVTCFAIGFLMTSIQACYAQAPPPPPSPPQASSAPPPPPVPVPFDDALLRAANDLFSKATLPQGGAKVELVIDPLIDGISGAQSTATRLMQDRIAALVRQTYPRF